MLYIGLDVHTKSCSYCIVDEGGRLVKEATMRGSWRRTVEAFKNLKEPFSVCFEASCGYGPLHDQLAKIAERVTVAHPGHLRLIFRSKKKNDRVDAAKLAKVLLLDEVPIVHVPSMEVRAWRGTTQYRSRMVARRTRVKNNLRALLRQCGIEAPRGLWTQRNRCWLANVELPTALDAMRRDMLLEELEHFDRQVDRIEQRLNTVVKRHAGVQLLMTIPGVGARTAEAVIAFIDDPSRFRGSKTVGSYFGLVPSQDSSGTTNHLGHITRQGPGIVRGLLTEAAWHGIRHSLRIRNYFERIQREDPGRKKIALVATAHYLVRVMYAMLRTGETWCEDRDEAQAA